MSFVSVQHLQKGYAGTPVFSDINCEVAKGEFVTLLGPSGCGKSTLLRCIAGLTPVDSGQILLDGQDIVPLSPQKRQIGMVFQSYALFPNMTVEQNVAFGLRMQKVNADDSHKRVQEVLQLVELKDLAGRYPHQMSGGQCQRVALARSLVTRPRLLLLDEPTTGLDPVARGEVLDAIADVLRDEERSILFSSHNTADIEQIADSITFLHRGGIVASRDKESFLDGWRRILCRGDWVDALRSLPGVASVRDSAPLIELKTGGFDATTLPALQALGLAVEAVEPMTLEDIFVTTVHGSRSA